MTSRTTPASLDSVHAALGDEYRPFELAAPFPFLARARAEAPVFYSPELDYWVVTRYDDVRAIFRDPGTFSSENTQSPYKPRPEAVQHVLDEGGFTGLLGPVGAPAARPHPSQGVRDQGLHAEARRAARAAGSESLTVSMIDAHRPRRAGRLGRGHRLRPARARDLPSCSEYPSLTCRRSRIGRRAASI